MDIDRIRKELEGLAEPEYQRFAASLIPGVEHLIGVRIPLIRKLAKKIVKENPVEYLGEAEDKYFEETMLQALVIGQMKKDIESVWEWVTLFVPKINNWSICDSFCRELKIVKSNKEKVWYLLTPYWQLKDAYSNRFAVVIMLIYYIDATYLSKLFEVFDHIHSSSYYVKMSVAWAVSMCFIKFPVETMVYLKKNKLDDETYNKSLQKIRDSLKVDQQTKEIIKEMKRPIIFPRKMLY